MDTRKVDAVIIGGGFYGSLIAIYLARQRNFRKIILVEKESKLIARASYANQARIHNGYHYPRSFTTAFRSRVNLKKFMRDWPEICQRDFTQIYAVARRNSKITSDQFKRFCKEIGAKAIVAGPDITNLFNSNLIEQAFITEEYAFDANLLTSWVSETIKNISNIEIRLNTEAKTVHKSPNGNLSTSIFCEGEAFEDVKSKYVFNCTYSGLNQLKGDYSRTQATLKHEVAEIALIKVPPHLKNVGVTVLDGHFFSTMPFPSRDMHTLSHVRYTPHFSWNDHPNVNPYKRLAEYRKQSRVDRMIRDAARYLPAISDVKYVESLYEIKTVLSKNEIDDGRPILIEKDLKLSGMYSILGGKIDNIYDALEKFDLEKFENEEDLKI